MTPALRRFNFTTHITSSVGWVGAVIAFRALAVIGLTSDDEQTVRSAYLVMAPAAWFVRAPLAHASLLSGIALSLGTTWGLFRHYWVALKLLITVFATVIFPHLHEDVQTHGWGRRRSSSGSGVVRNASPVVHAILALILLLAATVLGAYKPLGMTAYGRRKLDEQRQAVSTTLPRPGTVRAIDAGSTPRWKYLFGIIAIGIVLLFVLLHFIGSGLRPPSGWF